MGIFFFFFGLHGIDTPYMHYIHFIVFILPVSIYLTKFCKHYLTPLYFKEPQTLVEGINQYPINWSAKTVHPRCHLSGLAHEIWKDSYYKVVGIALKFWAIKGGMEVFEKPSHGRTHPLVFTDFASLETWNPKVT